MKNLEHILHVEDDSSIQEVVKVALETIGGLNVTTCSSGHEALETLEGLSTPPDMAVLDVMMPGMDGPTLLERLRQLPQGKSLPVVFMTAKVQPAEVEEYRKLGAVDVIVKPFDPMQLADELKRIWERIHE